MQKNVTKYTGNITGVINVTSDKSITHRAFIFAALCKGTSIIKNPLLAEDCLYTLKALNALGVNYRIHDNFDVTIDGVDGIKGFKQPKESLYLGNSGTGARLLTGLLSGCEGLNIIITGDESLSKRPMKRIIEPLEKMGALIKAREGCFLPLEIFGKKLEGLEYYALPMASAQVKSAILLAGLYASGNTVISGKILSRDHTENMMEFLNVSLYLDPQKKYLSLLPLKNSLMPQEFFPIPNDISSAAFFLVLGIIASSKGIYLRNIGINHTRSGIIKVLKRMGGEIIVNNERSECGEKVADIVVRKSELRATIINENEIPSLVDEIPIIVLVAVFAKGITVINGAGELRYKECDRLRVIRKEYSKIGVKIIELENGLEITGMGANAAKFLKAAEINTHFDHRIAMSFAIVGILINGKITLDDITCIETSFPTFFKCLEEVKN
ncbi:MAG: 3-phosphoshikimate 1-carboxyvinyltransferase [bacterium]|nr:3-phosphoshikimate 1-carboxyvinyltransferase [bacterium]